MYLMVEDNPNCQGDERMFAESGKAREVIQVNLDRPDGSSGWCDVVAVNDRGEFSSATGREAEDSAAGVTTLVRGGDWGLRLKPADNNKPWNLKETSQWGVPFLVLDNSPDVVRFK